MRVVSCVPSLSELAEELSPGCLAGRTRFCNSPSGLKSIPSIGGTKDLDTGRIIRLKPDLVLSVKEENTREQILELREAGLKVEVFDIRNLVEAIAMVEKCGFLLSSPEKAAGISARMKELLRPAGEKGSILYFIWKKPWMLAGRDTFIGDLLEKSGFRNLAPEGARYPELAGTDEIIQLHPDIIFLSSEPYPFREKDLAFFQNILPETRVMFVDGSIFSWYGSRTAMLPEFLRGLGFSD